ncbi:MAG: MBL fold metallo-hydrolase [Gammaproteobacteria bacterium]|nr:MBL fold metallo-hydrolase [Gammaproteobacteria bacterium]
MSTSIKSFFDEDTSTYSYVVADTASSKAAIIDPVMTFDPASGTLDGSSIEPLLDYIREQALEPTWILETHAHADHLSSAPLLKEHFPAATTAIGRGITRVQATFKTVFNLEEDFQTDGSQFDRLLEEGDSLPLGDMQIEVIATPGHTSDSVTYLIGDAAFVGDSIFMPDMGTARCDFPGGDATTLYQSIQKLFDLPDETTLYMCHDYAPGGREHRNVTTVGEERKHNIHVGEAHSLEDFKEMREARDKTLGAPRLLYPSVQVNIRAGHLPPAESNGRRYLKLPLKSVAVE